MKFIKVLDKADETIYLNAYLILTIEESICSATITDVLGNKYKSLDSYEDFLNFINNDKSE